MALEEREIVSNGRRYQTPWCGSNPYKKQQQQQKQQHNSRNSRSSKRYLTIDEADIGRSRSECVKQVQHGRIKDRSPIEHQQGSIFQSTVMEQGTEITGFEGEYGGARSPHNLRVIRDDFNVPNNAIAIAFEIALHIPLHLLKPNITLSIHFATYFALAQSELYSFILLHKQSKCSLNISSQLCSKVFIWIRQPAGGGRRGCSTCGYPRKARIPFAVRR